jgi:hypothetical protein
MEEHPDLPGNYKIVNHRFETYGICEGVKRNLLHSDGVLEMIGALLPLGG